METSPLPQDTSNLLHILEVVQRRIIPNLDPLRPHKHAALHPRRLTPVPRLPEASVILADGLVQLDADP